MDTNYTYLAIDLGSLIIPLIFSFHSKFGFYTKWAAFGLSNLIVCTLFIIWDMYYTHLGVWGFNPTYLTGIYIGNLPIEEILFFICIPFSSIYTYHCLKLFYPDRNKIPYEEITIIMAIVLLFVGALHLTNIYTSLTCILLAITLVLLTFVFNFRWIPNFYFSYLIILLPFFIVNGILTGTGLDAPIVWYDNTQNLGIRLGTIPVEDIFYGMLMLVLNTALFEFFDRKITSGQIR
ncbi:lycopene cyclase domain-containing protein [Cytophaga aurantiaca]|uniref:lycopene cyclase domain-containing protein n=1 Tax=Cytophaga aurantiaca TaxID=29530 RepID=UPI00035DE91F|nr:lycopene cyclase domain-containing protein [Cytophaga aurantiaca]